MIHQAVCYIGSGTDPCENLALERFLTETVREGELILYLWQNRRTVVIGRNQNAWRECRIAELKRDGGALVRRLSGGGAVYHDLGNLNFTFCVREADYDLRRQQAVIVEACRLLGIQAEVSGRNDLLAGGRKFSGNSFYAHAGRAFHNGTLLIDADMECLGRYLNPSQAKLAGKGVASVRSRVVNLKELRPDLTVEAMCSAMSEAMGTIYALPVTSLAAERLDRARLETLRTEFADRAWIYGKNLPFTISCSNRFPWGEMTAEFSVSEGNLLNTQIYTDAMDASLGALLSDALRGCRFSAEELCARLRGLPLDHAVLGDICSWLMEQEF